MASRWGVSLKQEKPPRLRRLLLSKSGAEGQSRTDTGSPPPVFKPVARLGTEASLDQSLDTSRELVPYSFTAIRQHPGTRSRRSLPTLDLVHEQAVDDTGAIFEVLNRRAFIDSVEVDRRT